jgi:pimeloyl-ACP methyl ester carboxylesterase
MVRGKRNIGGKGLIGQGMRRLRLEVLSRVVRPFVHARESETISFAERQADLVLSKMMRQFMRQTGFPSRTACTSFGLMHYYDSDPFSHEIPFVMIHGMGSSGQCFAMVAEAIRKKRRVILPDLFHFSGFSEPNNPVMTLDQHVQSLRELLQELGVSSCDVVGLSLGGWISQKLAVSSPELVHRLMLLNTAGLRFGTILLRDKLSMLSWEKFQKLFPGVLYASPYQGVPIISPIVRRSLFRLLKDHAVRDFLKTIRPSDFMEPYLSQITCPVMVLWGDRDTFLSQQTPHFILKHVPGARGFYVENCAHILCLEAPLNCLEHMNLFFDLGLDFDSPLLQLIAAFFGRYDERPIQSQAYEKEQSPAQGSSRSGLLSFRLSG